MMNPIYSFKNNGIDFKVYLDMLIPEPHRTSIRRYFGEELMMLTPMIFSISDPEVLEAELKSRKSSPSTLILFLVDTYTEKWLPVTKLALETVGNVIIFTRQPLSKSQNKKNYAGIGKSQDNEFFGSLNLYEKPQRDSIFSCFSGCSSHPDDYKRSFLEMNSSVFDAIEKIKENLPNDQHPDWNISNRSSVKKLVSKPTSGGHPFGKEEQEIITMKTKKEIKGENEANGQNKGTREGIEKPKMNGLILTEKREGKKSEFSNGLKGTGKKKEELGPKKFEEEDPKCSPECFLEDGSVGQVSMYLRDPDDLDDVD